MHPRLLGGQLEQQTPLDSPSEFDPRAKVEPGSGKHSIFTLTRKPKMKLRSCPQFLFLVFCRRMCVCVCCVGCLQLCVFVKMFGGLSSRCLGPLQVRGCVGGVCVQEDLAGLPSAGSPLLRTGPPPDRPKFRSFLFLSHRKIRSCLLSLGGLLVEFWWCL